MTKRNCFVAQVGDAIEALADALDPERTKPFKGDILDLLEWAERDVMAMRAKIANLNQPVVLSEWQQLQNDNAQLRQQVTLLRDAVKMSSESMDFALHNRDLVRKKLAEALAATEPKP